MRLAARPLDPASRLAVRLRPWLASAFWLPVCVYYAAHRGEYGVIDHGDLMIHEAGHFVFRFFGFWMHAAGGTLMQLLLPSLLAFHFARHSYRLGAQAGLFWLGHNALNISVYAADARLRRLPLLGGDAVFHDWATMLGAAGLLEYDQWIGYGFVLAGWAAFALAVLLPRWMRA